jgi:hypothetical protein
MDQKWSGLVSNSRNRLNREREITRRVKAFRWLFSRHRRTKHSSAGETFLFVSKDAVDLRAGLRSSSQLRTSRETLALPKTSRRGPPRMRRCPNDDRPFRSSTVRGTYSHADLGLVQMSAWFHAVLCEHSSKCFSISYSNCTSLRSIETISISRIGRPSGPRV